MGFGWAHATGNGSLNGFNISAAAHFQHRVALAAFYDGVYDTQNIGVFQLTPIGLVTEKNHLQNFMIGPRIYFPSLLKGKSHTLDLLNLFAQAQFGGSHLNTEIHQAATDSRVGSDDSAFSWMLGGGTDVRLTSHWSARGDVDLLRTHFADAGQSRLRFVIGVAYFLKGRK